MTFMRGDRVRNIGDHRIPALTGTVLESWPTSPFVDWDGESVPGGWGSA